MNTKQGLSPADILSLSHRGRQTGNCVLLVPSERRNWGTEGRQDLGLLFRSSVITKVLQLANGTLESRRLVGCLPVGKENRLPGQSWSPS